MSVVLVICICVFIVSVAGLIVFLESLRKQVSTLSETIFNCMQEEEMYRASKWYTQDCSDLKLVLGDVVARLNRIVPEDLKRHVEELTKLKARQMTGQATALAEREKARAAELEDWLCAICGGRDSMQAQANNGLPAGISAEARGRLVSHLERHQIKLPRSGASGGTEGGKDGASEPLRSRGHGSQR